ncbi:hypothetical protein [Gluconobacter morbifer]|uniref:Uncharacterized protein n=1 Tax=Gluconobacter morbifer G707 TaxID=1088869 RepID=G6XEZ1_9PROT|nr:hypothetical protein [Gluconobacter morbifer]EHH68749.1 hypothetical protein GMO_00560 [Gluconobacter morbifer G707]
MNNMPDRNNREAKMRRMHVRIWIGLVACLLMQVGLLATALPVQAASMQSSAMRHMTHCSSRPVAMPSCSSHAMVMTPRHASSHGGSCCHVRVSCGEPLLTLTETEAVPDPLWRAHILVQVIPPPLHGTDRIPASPPPKPLTV